jgi:TonB family protein
VYPELAKRARVSGQSLLEVTINEQGEVYKVRVIRSGHPLLQLAAVEAVRLWRYSPMFRDGVAVPVITTVTVPFKLRLLKNEGLDSRTHVDVTSTNSDEFVICGRNRRQRAGSRNKPANLKWSAVLSCNSSD